MQKSLKNLTSFFLLSLLITHGIIQFGMFELFRADYRAEAARLIDAGVPVHGQVVFSFEKNEFTRIEWKDDDEFRFEGNLYDIIRTETNGDSVYVYCIYDEDDTSLYAVLDKLIEKDKDDPEEKDGSGISLSQFYFCENFNYKLDNPRSADEVFFCPGINPLEGEYLLITPPPRSIV